MWNLSLKKNAGFPAFRECVFRINVASITTPRRRFVASRGEPVRWCRGHFGNHWRFSINQRAYRSLLLELRQHCCWLNPSGLFSAVRRLTRPPSHRTRPTVFAEQQKTTAVLSEPPRTRRARSEGGNGRGGSDWGVGHAIARRSVFAIRVWCFRVHSC